MDAVTTPLDPGTPPPAGFVLGEPDEWEYFSEGASNILFRYTGEHPYFRRFLLRLRKALPGAPTTLMLHDHLATRFAPLLHDYLLRTDLIELAPAFVCALNASLVAAAAQPRPGDCANGDGVDGEGAWAGAAVGAGVGAGTGAGTGAGAAGAGRGAGSGPGPGSGSGTRAGGVRARRQLDEAERWGMLVEDMSCGNYLFGERGGSGANGGGGGNSSGDSSGGSEASDPGEEWRDMATIEFKPKWLTQSPNAPPNWTLCRTCAVRLMNGRGCGRWAGEGDGPGEGSGMGEGNGMGEGEGGGGGEGSGEGEGSGGDGNSSRGEGRGRGRGKSEGSVPEYCPLDLVSGDRERIETAVYALVNARDAVMIADPIPDHGDDDDAMDTNGDGDDDGRAETAEQVAHQLAKTLECNLVSLLSHFFRLSPIIPLLAELQHRFGSRGVFTSFTLALMSDGDGDQQLPAEAELALASASALSAAADPRANDIWTAMTLRDCSMFLRVWVRRPRGRAMEARVDCKVGDLDLKTGDGGRAVYWRDVERRLRKGGWYVRPDVGRNCRTGRGAA